MRRKQSDLPTRDFACNALPIDDLDGRYRRSVPPWRLRAARSRRRRNGFAVMHHAFLQRVTSSEVSDGDASLTACNAVASSGAEPVTRCVERERVVVLLEPYRLAGVPLVGVEGSYRLILLSLISVCARVLVGVAASNIRHPRKPHRCSRSSVPGKNPLLF